MKEKIDKYIDLLLKKCLNFNKSKILFISYDKINKDFVEKVIEKAKLLGINEIETDEEDIYLVHDKLKTMTLDEIETDPYFNKEKWNIYAEKGANFLMLDTEFPGIMDDIEPEKLAKTRHVKTSTRQVFREKETTYQIPWCIAAVPNEIWARNIFGNIDNAYDKLFEAIFDVCMINTEDPISSWNNYLSYTDIRVKKMNELKIRTLHYKNSLGTDLEIEMPENHIWTSAASDKERDMLVNMPSYEIFSSPNYMKTNGIVYSSRPLIYAGGIIDNFYLKFIDGKVVDYDAEKGKEILKDIIEGDSNSCYLGEVALVNNDSPVSNTGLVFGTTLFDENASCHLALGDGFSECIKDGLLMSKEELLKHGINKSFNHVDFMIGTSDLEIEATTENGKVTIFKNGNFEI